MVIFVPVEADSTEFKLAKRRSSPNSCPLVLYGMVWYGMLRYGMVWYGTVQYGMVWYMVLGMVWYGMVWYGVVW